MVRDEILEFINEDSGYNYSLPTTQLEQAMLIIENDIAELSNIPYLHESLLAIHEFGQINTMSDLDAAIDEVLGRRDAYRRIPAIYKIICWIGGLLGIGSYGAAYHYLSTGINDAKNNINQAGAAIERGSGSISSYNDAINKVNSTLKNWFGRLWDKNTYGDHNPIPPVNVFSPLPKDIADNNAAAQIAISDTNTTIDSKLKWALRGLQALGIIGLSAAFVYLGWRLVKYFSDRTAQKVYYSDMTPEEKKSCLQGLLIETDRFIAKNKNKNKEIQQHLEQTRDMLNMLIKDIDSQTN